MIRVRQDGQERELSYGDFIREVQEGTITAEMPVLSEVLTSGVWKPAGELQFFRSWAPPGTVLPRPEEKREEPVGPASTEPVGPAGAEPAVPADAEEPASAPPRQAGEPWIPYGEQTPGPAPERPPLSETPPPPPDTGAYGGGWAPPQPEPVQPGAPLPWEEIERRGFLGGLAGTIRLAFGDPEGFFRGIARGRGLVPALVFGLLLTALSIAVESIYDLMSARFLAGMVQSMQSELPEFLRGDIQANIRQTVLMRGVFILFYPLFVFLASGLIHLMLRAFGSPRRDFAATFRVVNYASAVDVLMILPICGGIVVYVWELVMIVRGLSRLHGMGGIRVVAAVLFPMALMICLWMQAMVLFGFLQGGSSGAR